MCKQNSLWFHLAALPVAALPVVALPVVALPVVALLVPLRRSVALLAGEKTAPFVPFDDFDAGEDDDPFSFSAFIFAAALEKVFFRTFWPLPPPCPAVPGKVDCKPVRAT